MNVGLCACWTLCNWTADGDGTKFDISHVIYAFLFQWRNIIQLIFNSSFLLNILNQIFYQ